MLLSIYPFSILLLLCLSPSTFLPSVLRFLRSRWLPWWPPPNPTYPTRTTRSIKRPKLPTLTPIYTLPTKSESLATSSSARPSATTLRPYLKPMPFPTPRSRAPKSWSVLENSGRHYPTILVTNGTPRPRKSHPNLTTHTLHTHYTHTTHLFSTTLFGLKET